MKKTPIGRQDWSAAGDNDRFPQKESKSVIFPPFEFWLLAFRADVSAAF